jgi:hypothetical protein
LLNKALFERLCKQYGVEWNEQYDTVMIQDEDRIYPLSEDTVENVITETRNESICLPEFENTYMFDECDAA